jgi:hypothetical protein
MIVRPSEHLIPLLVAQPLKSASILKITFPYLVLQLSLGVPLEPLTALLVLGSACHHSLPELPQDE